MKKILISIFAFLSLVSCEGKNKTVKNEPSQVINLPVNNTLTKENIKNMDTIYKQDHKELTIVSTRTADSTKIEWKTILIDKDNDKLLLDSFRLDRSLGWKKIEQDYGYTQYGQYTISTSYLDDNNLYIIYQKSGKIFTTKYTFDKKGKFHRVDKHIQNHFQTPSFSKNEVISTVKRFEKSLYINLLYKASRLGKEQALYKIDLNAFSVKKIKFSEAHKIIKVYALSKFGKLDYSQNKRKIEAYNKMSSNEKKENKSSAPTAAEIEYINTLKKYLNESFYYEEMSSNKDIYYKENLHFENLGLESYVLFSSNSNNATEVLPLDRNKILNAEDYLKEVLNIYEIKEPKISVNYLGYIYQSQPDFIIFFFYQSDSLGTKITRYDNYKNEWIIGSYVEEEIILEK